MTRYEEIREILAAQQRQVMARLQTQSPEEKAWLRFEREQELYLREQAELEYDDPVDLPFRMVMYRAGRAPYPYRPTYNRGFL
jgi:hypothetical protein